MRKQPKLIHLPPTSSTPDSGLSETLEKIWEIDVCDISWSIALSYLIGEPNIMIDTFLQDILLSETIWSKRKINAKVLKIKKIVRKFNPFLKTYDIQNEIEMDILINCFKNYFFSDFNKNNWHSVLQNVSNRLICVIYLYSFDSKENCQLFSVLKPNSKSGDYPKLIILCHSENIHQPTELPKFNFGLPSELAENMRQNGLNKILRKVNLSEVEKQEINNIISSGKNFLVCLLQSSIKTIIPVLYEPPYIARKLDEAGLDVDPRLTDENGLSSFHYCMNLPETRILWLLYNFAANMFHREEHTVRHPNDQILDTLRQIGRIIENDMVRAQKISSLTYEKTEYEKTEYEKTAGQILRFNQYQRELIEETFRLKETKDREHFKTKMLFIFKKYKEYFHFKSPLCNHTLDLRDELCLFQNFVLHSEYHENLDVFTSLMFFDQFPHVTEYITQTNENIFTDALSSAFLSVLSNNLFPKYEHKENVCLCGLQPDICEKEKNGQRFVAFYYRQCFLSKAEDLANELESSNDDAEKHSTDLLETIRNSLKHLPEIEDEFLIAQIKHCLETATDFFFSLNASEMLVFERTLQVLGDILSNKTVGKTAVRFLLSCCLPKDLRLQIIKIRHHCLSKYRSSSVQGRLNIERRNHAFLNSIYQELHAIHQVIESVFSSQRFRVKEFLIEKCKNSNGCILQNITSELDEALSEIIIKRKEIFLSEKESFSFLLRALFNYAIGELGAFKEFTDFKDLGEAINFLLKFVATHWEEHSTTLLHISDELRTVTLSVETNEITDHVKSKLNAFLVDNLRILENTFSNFQTCLSLFNSPYSALPSLLSQIKDFDPFTPIEKIAIKQKLSEFITQSNETIKTLISNCSKKEPPVLEIILEGIIMPETKGSDLKNCFLTINKKSELRQVFRDTDPIEPNEFANEEKRLLIDKCICKNFSRALKILRSLNQEQEIETWYKKQKDDILNFELEKEEHLSVFLKLSLPKVIKSKLIINLNQKMCFLINRIRHMKRLLIFEDVTIHLLWKTTTWRDNKNAEMHLKSALIQRYSTEKRVKMSLELLLYDCMLLLKSDDTVEFWKKTNNMFIGSNLIEILAHGNPLIETSGYFLDPTDLPSDFIDKIINLIEVEPVLNMLCIAWLQKKTCKESSLIEYIYQTDDLTCIIIKNCPKWKSYLKLLPLKR